MLVRRTPPCLMLVLLALLAACADRPAAKPVTPLTLDYTRLGPIKLAVSKLDFINHSPLVPPADAAAVSFKPQLADAAYRWGLDRLQPVAAEGVAVYNIANAKLTRTKLPQSGGINSWFTRQPAEKWVAALTVKLQVTNAAGGFNGHAEATVTRSTTLPEGATASEQENAYRRVLLALMDDLNSAMTQAIQQHLGPVLVTTP